MEIRKLKIDGTYEIKPKKIGDSRGYFAETYREDIFFEHGLQTKWVQENQSLSTRVDTIRGLHFQEPPFAQSKLVSASLGQIYDVFVDIRKDSTTFGQWDAILLSDELCNSVYIPKGFAHGFCTRTENTIVRYKVDNLYSREAEKGVRWDDPKLAIDWNVSQPIVSERDLSMSLFSDLITSFS